MGQDIALRQPDNENLIRDKAALYAGSRILLNNMGLSFADVARVLIAGNFGRSLDIEQAVRIGLLPDISRERIRFIGNSLPGRRTAGVALPSGPATGAGGGWQHHHPGIDCGAALFRGVHCGFVSAADGSSAVSVSAVAELRACCKN